MADLDPSGYTFTSQPTKKETERFEYVAFDYIDNNPGYVSSAFNAYIGIYWADNGDTNKPN